MENALVNLMEENLARVWSERDAVKRLEAIENIYTSDSALYHVGDQTNGREAINKSITSTLANMPADFIFFKLKPVVINNNVGRLIWGVGPNAQSLVATGMDIVVFESGKIKSLYVFLDGQDGKNG
ncbi:nuclear transport factor 2 family protein [uncultured Flavobacterium sp.]|uniref:nuclear transport factor 2 family protein n=1 Tax=uncultured Flavobacterium sp. TaxID=165435 RepID=UPI002931CA4E|nr:nuclear transport factor 2 family protein [uncultured Flavobacterium sp.]